MQDSRIKNEEQYNTLLQKGYGEEKSDRITSSSNSINSIENGGRVRPYIEWTKEELYEQARKVGIKGRSYMSKKNLVNSLRNSNN